MRTSFRSTTLLLAGSFFLSCGLFSAKVKKGAVIDGVDVGGMTFSEAEAVVREKLEGERIPFVLHTPSGDCFPELSYSDDLATLVRKVGKGERAEVLVTRQWTDAEEQIARLCAEHARGAVDAELSFSPDGFVYTPGKAGVACDFEGTLRDALEALRTGKNEATMCVFSYAPEVTERDLRARTRPLASYSTRFDASNAPRAHNIGLAAERISGTVLPPGGEFSFNAVVGKRTAENGFLEAAVIRDGEFVQGVGGGVCQASTTLMNAALRAGLVVTESRPQSLAVGYAPPSADAMVSETSDLRFRNPYGCPVYLLGEAGGGRVRFSFYGLPDGKRYAMESKVLFRVEPPPEKIVEGEEDRIVRAAKAGLASESWLLVYDGRGTLLSRTLFRRDTYAVVQGIREVKRSAPETDAPETP